MDHTTKARIVSSRFTEDCCIVIALLTSTIIIFHTGEYRDPVPKRVPALFPANHPPTLYFSIPLKIQVFNFTWTGDDITETFKLRNFISETSNFS